MSNDSIQNAAFAATTTSGIVTFINQNSTIISLGITLFFGLIYASCHIFNTVMSHRERVRNRSKECRQLVKEELEKNGESEAARAIERLPK